jgi:hypothetical protein
MSKRFVPFAPQRRFHRFIDGLPLFLHQQGGGEGGGAAGNTNPPPAPHRENPADVAARYSGDAIRMASKISELESDNFNYRDKIRDRDREISDLKKAVPAEGALVLTGDDAKAWPEYQKLGKPEDLSKTIQDGRAALAKNAETEKQTTLDEAAKYGDGTRPFKAGLLKLAAKDLNVQMREVDVTDSEGKVTKAKQPFVLLKEGDTETPVPLAKHLKTQDEDVFNSLFDDGSGNGSGSQNGQQNGSQQQSGGFQYPAQQGGTGTGGNQQKTPAASGITKSRYAHNMPKKEG